MDLNCPHNEIKLKQNSFKTVSKLFWNCFETFLFQFHFVVRTVLRSISGRNSATYRAASVCTALDGGDLVARARALGGVPVFCRRVWRRAIWPALRLTKRWHARPTFSATKGDFSIFGCVTTGDCALTFVRRWQRRIFYNGTILPPKLARLLRHSIQLYFLCCLELLMLMCMCWKVDLMYKISNLNWFHCQRWILP